MLENVKREKNGLSPWGACHSLWLTDVLTGMLVDCGYMMSDLVNIKWSDWMTG